MKCTVTVVVLSFRTGTAKLGENLANNDLLLSLSCRNTSRGDWLFRVCARNSRGILNYALLMIGFAAV